MRNINTYKLLRFENKNGPVTAQVNFSDKNI